MSSPSRFQVDPDVRRAETLDKAFYLDAAVQAQARERIFARSWQWLGDLAEVAAPGALSPRDLLPGWLDEPLLLARDGSGTLRCLSNVCTHRGNLLVQAACQDAKQIRCGYHSRRFELDGRMVFMPEFQQALDFPRPCDDLPQVSMGDWGGHAFVALEDPLAPFGEVIAPLRDRLAWLPVGSWRLDATRSRDYEFDAHWALYVENYLEGLHIPFVHPGLSRTLDLAQYVTSPASNEFWCGLQPVPCFEPGSTIEEIFPDDPVKQERWRGYVEPGALNTRFSGLDINNAFGPANAVEEVKVYQDYLGGTTTLDQALEAWQRLADQLADNAIMQHPEWNADTWQ